MNETTNETSNATANNSITIGDILNFSLEAAKKNFLKFFGLILFAFAVFVVLGGIFFGLGGDNQVMSSLGSLVMMVASISISMGFIQNTINLCAGKGVNFKDFLPQPMVFLNFLIGMIIVGIAVTIGFILLIIPGIILGTMLNLVPYLILDEKMNAIEAIQESIKRTKGYKMDIFVGLFIVGIIINLLSLPIITLIFTIPMACFAYIYPYLRLTGKLDQAKTELIANG